MWPAVLLFVPDVTVLFSLANGDRQVLFDSDCGLVERFLREVKKT